MPLIDVIDATDRKDFERIIRENREALTADAKALIAELTKRSLHVSGTFNGVQVDATFQLLGEQQ